MKNKKFGDWAIALTVILCSGILLAALFIALSGLTFSRSERIIRVNFPDVTGVNPSADVKYAGAYAGIVSSIRILSREERQQSGNPRNAIQLELSLLDDVPEIPADARISVAADTLLSDKYILIEAGSVDAAPLAADAVLQGIPPVTFDQLARNLDGLVDGVNDILQGTPGDTKDVFDRLNGVLVDTQTLLKDAQGVIALTKPVVTDAQGLLSETRSLITDNKDGITKTLRTLDKTTITLDQLATRVNTLFASNEKRITSVLIDSEVTLKNFKVTSTYLKILTRSIAARPSQLVWGSGKNAIPLPPEQQILRSQRPVD